MGGVVALLFHRTGQLAQRNDGHIHLFGHDLEVSGDGADFLYTVLGALARGHQLQIVNDDEAHIGAAGVLVHPADLGFHLGDGDARGVIHINGRVMELLGGKGQVLPVLRPEGAGAERLAVDAGLRREDPVGQLLLGHFEAENGHRYFLLHGYTGGNVQRKTGLAHTGAGSQNNKVAAAKAGEHGVQQAEACRDTLVLIGIRAADLLQIGQRFHHAGRKGRQGAGIPPGADLINALLGVFQQQVRVRLVARILQDIFRHTHELADQIFFLHDLGVGFHIGDAGHRLGQTGQVDFRLVRAGKHAV